MTDRVTMRPAGPQDLSILRYWDSLPHIQASGGPEDDWEWETELGRAPWPDWRWWFMAEVGSRAVGFLAIIDPAREASHYWGADCPPNLRAIDVWIGEQSDHRRGLGRQMMAAALAHSFSDPDVAAVLTDPLAANADAHAFYQAMGFHPDGPRQFGPDDCLVHRITRAQWMAHPKRILPMPKVLIADKLSPLADDIFQARGVDVDRKIGLSKDELIAIIADYDGLAVRSATKPDADVIAAATKLKVIGRAGIGVDNVDVAAATERGVVVMNTPYGNAITTAEHAIAMLFAAARQIPAADASTQAGKWEKSRFVGMELYGKTLGVIGCGNIGSIVADRALGLKMKVIAFDPFLTPERAVEIGVEKVDLDDLLARADAITLHTPLTDKTRNILSAEAIGKTKPGVVIVNCARGGLVDEPALRAALDTGHVKAAALDVFMEEPASENALFGAENFTATPHLGAATREAQENVALQIAEQMADYLTTGAVQNALNTPAVSAEDAPRIKPYATLAERLGLLAGQLISTGLRSVEVEISGAAAELNPKPITAAALAGVLRPAMSDVNMVSAPAAAKARGVTVSETITEGAGAHDALVTVTVQTERRTRSVSGALFAGEPRIVDIDGVAMDAAFHRHMLYVENDDKPGFIGGLGAALGAGDINIATFNLGRKSEGGDALALVAIDQALTADVTGAVEALAHVRAARTLAF